MKRIYRFLFISFALVQLLIFFFSNDLLCQTNKVRVIKKDAELKLKPSNESLTIMSLPIGGEFDIEDTVGEWIKVKLLPDKDGIILTGYINSSFLEFKLAPKPLPIISKADRESLGSGQGDDYLKWQEKMNSVRSRKSLWSAVSYSGAAILLVSGVFTIVNLAKDEDPVEEALRELYREPKVPTLAIVGDVFGLVTIVAGGAGQSAANNYEKQLKSEGESKGYLRAGLLSKYGAIGIQFGISF